MKKFKLGSPMVKFLHRLLVYGLGFGVVYWLFAHWFNFDKLYAHLPTTHQGEAGAQFGPPVPRRAVSNTAADEISGLVAAQGRRAALWGHNDSGDIPRLFLIGEDGADLGTYTFPATARDWEDMAACWIDSTYYLFLGDIGDNDSLYEIKYIYRVPEPDLAGAGPGQRAVIGPIDTLRFRYPDGNRDAETLLADPISRNIYVVSKRERNVHLYVLAYPQDWQGISTAQLIGELPFNTLTSGDISANGQEILLKNYQQVYYWQRRAGETVEGTLRRPPLLLPYQEERRGEALAFDRAGTGYYTLGEDVKKYRATLFFYPRKPE